LLSGRKVTKTGGFPSAVSLAEIRVLMYRSHRMPTKIFDVAIIGAGIVGLAIGKEILRRQPRTRLLILDKEKRVAAHQTGHNSGVIHSGLYYKPGSLKAQLSVQGARSLVDFCREHGVPHRICGKLVVATEAQELPALEELYRRGVANGVPGLRMIEASEIPEIEPHTSGLRALHVPGTGITDYQLVSEKYAEIILASGGQLSLDNGVEAVFAYPNEIVLRTPHAEFHASYVINCAGLHSDAVARMAHADLDLRIVPFRGEYYDIAQEKQHLVRGLIYPVPDPRFPFLGVHFTTRIDGSVEAGPNAVLALAREGYSKSDVDPGEIAGLLAFPGFWVMGAKYWRNGAAEYYRSFSKAAFLKSLQKFLPQLTMDDLRPGGSGVRAQALDRKGHLVDDFRFAFSERMLHVCNVPSPAATASLAIASTVVNQFEERAALALAK
jgi:L-2-hydroxyglutarate oxidase LhgO